VITHTRSPFQDPEFLRSRIIIPYDYETQILAERQDEARAVYLFTLRRAREERFNAARGILAALGICACGWAIAVWWCL
jgi:hypothetical protein